MKKKPLKSKTLDNPKNRIEKCGVRATVCGENATLEKSVSKADHLKDVRNVWTSETAPRQNGRPRGYVSFADAYRYVSTISLEDAQSLVAGTFPEDWDKSKSLNYVLAARAYLDGSTRAVPSLLTELADRSDGKVTQPIAQTVALQGVIALPAPPRGVTWAEVVSQHIDSPALNPAPDGED